MAREWTGWDKEEVVAQIGKNDKGDYIQVMICSKREKEFVDVRQFWHDKQGNVNPGKGIAIPADLADEIAQAIMDATQIDLNKKKKGSK